MRMRLVRTGLATVMLPIVMLAAGTPAASADQNLQVETYVLPLGASKPSLSQLQQSDGLSRLRQLAAQGEPSARLPLETTGPAAAYASRARLASNSPETPAAPRREGAVSVAAVSAPEPARTMTLAECARGLGTRNKFYVKSRFAVCDGASFVQTWLRNNRPVGESMFNVRVVGTIPANSRTVNFQYHFSDFTTTGSTGTASMPITVKGNLPQSWPSGARYTRGGSLPSTSRTFTQLKTVKTYNQTVSAAPGQGKGSADLLFAVYEPSVSYRAPAPWKLSGATGGKLFMLAPRWDAASYLSNSTGGGNPARKGAAAFSYVTPLTLSAKAGAPERAEAAHIRQAFLVPDDTKPYMAAKKVPGQTVSDPLHRTVSSTRADKNRSAAKKQCRRYWGANYANGGKECDEYPFASTYEGAALPEYDSEAKKFNFSVKPINGTENRNGGLILQSFYGKNRIIDGMDDGFIVKVIT